MKHLFLALLFLTAGAAQAASLAETVEALSEDNAGKFEELYRLDSFTISPESSLLEGLKPTVGGVYLDVGARVLRLVVQQGKVCNAGEPCPEARFASLALPVVIELPVTYIGSPICGGRVITAEKDLRRTDGGLTRIQVIDNNGNRCGNADDLTFVKRVRVTLTEESARSNSPAVSTLSGFPLEAFR